MGRFDALTNLSGIEEKKIITPTVPAPAQKQPIISRFNKPKKEDNDHEIMKSRNHEKLPSSKDAKLKPIKYSTLIDPDLIKKVKLYAAERELKDYEVIEIALLSYFGNHS